MEFYCNKKKTFTSFLIWSAILLVLVSALSFIFDYVDNNSDSESLIVISIFCLFPLALVASINFVRFTYLLFISERLLLRINEQGILLNMNKVGKKSGLISWSEISNIIVSSDNMNKPAVRITLEGHIKGVYQFYITTPDAKNMGLTLTELFDMIMSYYQTNKRK